MLEDVQIPAEAHEARLLAVALNKALRPSGVTLAQLGVLEVVGAATAPLNHRQVAAELTRSAGDLTRLVDALVDAELVARVRSVQDRRIVYLEITDAGRAVVVAATAVLAAAVGTLDGLSRRSGAQVGTP